MGATDQPGVHAFLEDGREIGVVVAAQSIEGHARLCHLGGDRYELVVLAEWGASPVRVILTGAQVRALAAVVDRAERDET